MQIPDTGDIAGTAVRMSQKAAIPEDSPQVDPVAAYDKIAPVYTDISSERRAYLDRVEKIVIEAIPRGASSLLDVGAGDGSRSQRIAAAAGIGRLVLLEPSAAMRPAADNAEIWRMRAEELNGVTGRFDVITCLWNVLGHVLPAAARVDVLRQLCRLSSPDGRIFVDVNNRYNARHYGWAPVLGRYLRDHLSPDVTNGDVTVTWDVKGSKCITKGHVFTSAEFHSMADAAGLSIVTRHVIDYRTGELRRHSWEGNLLYELKALR